MFIKVADRELDPATLILGRIALAARRRSRSSSASRSARARTLRGAARALAPRSSWSGSLNTAVPFWLLSWGETRIDSGLASIIQASVPIFNVLLAFGFFHEQRVTGSRLVGVAVGFVGVALLVGAQPEGKILGALAVVGMAVCYAAGGLLIRRYLSAARPPVVALGTSAVAAIARAAGRGRACAELLPGWETIGSVVFLGIVGTAFAYLLFFTIIAGAGAVVRLVRHVPRAAGRARVRRDLPRRERRGAARRRARPDPRRRRARHRALPSRRASGADGCRAVVRTRAVRAVVIALRRADAGRRRLARRALHGRRRRAVPRRPAARAIASDRGRGRALAARARGVRPHDDRGRRRARRRARLRARSSEPHRIVQLERPRGPSRASAAAGSPTTRRGSCSATCSASSASTGSSSPATASTSARSRMPSARASCARASSGERTCGTASGRTRCCSRCSPRSSTPAATSARS